MTTNSEESTATPMLIIDATLVTNSEIAGLCELPEDRADVLLDGYLAQGTQQLVEVPMRSFSRYASPPVPSFGSANT